MVKCVKAEEKCGDCPHKEPHEKEAQCYTEFCERFIPEDLDWWCKEHPRSMHYGAFCEEIK